MKTIKKLTVLFCLTFLTTSCFFDGLNRISGNRNVQTENRNIDSDFNQIKATSGIDVYITQSQKTSVLIKADDNLHEHIKTTVENGVLKIYSKQNIGNAKSKKVYVSLPELTELKGTSGANVYTENTFKVESITIKATSGAYLSLSLNAKEINSSSTSGADLNLKGKAIHLISSATSGSDTDTYELMSDNVEAKVTSGASINVTAINSLDAKATSGGDIDYKGSPKTINRKTSSGGSISSH